jgi:hypothetical protein
MLPECVLRMPVMLVFLFGLDILQYKCYFACSSLRKQLGANGHSVLKALASKFSLWRLLQLSFSSYMHLGLAYEWSCLARLDAARASQVRYSSVIEVVDRRDRSPLTERQSPSTGTTPHCLVTAVHSFAKLPTRLHPWLAHLSLCLPLERFFV